MKTAVTVAAVLAMSGAAMADELLLVDLTVPGQVTISATAGLSAVDASGSDTTGVYLQGGFGAPTGPFSASLVSGDLTNFENPTDNSPSLFRASGTDNGLNIWSFSSDATVTFTAGGQAFTGSATWLLDPAEYDAIANGTGSGDIYFAADDASDLPNAVVLGTWRVIIPTPGTAGLLGLAGFAAVRRRR